MRLALPLALVALAPSLCAGALAPAAPAAPCLQPRNIQPRLEQLSTHGRRMQIMFTAWGHSGQEVQGEGGLLCKTKRRRTNETLRLWALLLDRANSWGV